MYRSFLGMKINPCIFYLLQLSHEQEEAERLELQRLLNQDNKDNVLTLCVKYLH